MTSSRVLTRIRFIALAVAASLAALAVAAPAAQAGPLVSSAPDCADEALSQPFLPWVDAMQYQFGPDGGFEAGGDGWDLDGGATAVTGNESHYVHDSGDSQSLALPAGSSATSPTICVGLEHPTIRFFARKTSGLLAAMAVSVRFEDASGDVLSAPIGVVTPSSSWQPTLPMPVVANLLALLPGEHTPVQFRFTPVLGSWQIDDLYVDPMRKR